MAPLVLGVACQTPTQAFIEVSLAPGDVCASGSTPGFEEISVFVETSSAKLIAKVAAGPEEADATGPCPNMTEADRSPKRLALHKIGPSKRVYYTVVSHYRKAGTASASCAGEAGKRATLLVLRCVAPLTTSNAGWSRFLRCSRLRASPSAKFALRKVRPVWPRTAWLLACRNSKTQKRRTFQQCPPSLIVQTVPHQSAAQQVLVLDARHPSAHPPADQTKFAMRTANARQNPVGSTRIVLQGKLAPQMVSALPDRPLAGFPAFGQNQVERGSA
jgi:hypothetical protein